MYNVFGGAGALRILFGLARGLHNFIIWYYIGRHLTLWWLLVHTRRLIATNLVSSKFFPPNPLQLSVVTTCLPYKTVYSEAIDDQVKLLADQLPPPPPPVGWRSRSDPNVIHKHLNDNSSWEAGLHRILKVLQLVGARVGSLKTGGRKHSQYFVSANRCHAHV